VTDDVTTVPVTSSLIDHISTEGRCRFFPVLSIDKHSLLTWTSCFRQYFMRTEVVYFFPLDHPLSRSVVCRLTFSSSSLSSLCNISEHVTDHVQQITVGLAESVYLVLKRAPLCGRCHDGAAKTEECLAAAAAAAAISPRDHCRAGRSE